MAVGCPAYLYRFCNNVTENRVVFFTVICPSTVEFNQITNLHLVHLPLVKCHSDIANWSPGRYLGTAHQPPFPPGCILVTGLRISGRVSMCLFVQHFSLVYLEQIKGADSSAFWSTVSLGVTHCSSLVLLEKKKTCSCGPLSPCSGAAFI